MRASAWFCVLLLGPTIAAAEGAVAGSGERTISLGSTMARAITFDDALSHDPSWSPDGRWIVYVSDAEGPDGVSGERLWIAPATGGEPQRRLTAGHGGDESFSDYYPAWSPDGEHIAFSSNRGDETHIWVVPASGGELRRVTRIPLDVLPVATSPRWAPDGSHLAFAGAADGGDVEIFLVPSDGGERRRFTFDAMSNSHCDWSPDGRELAYGSVRSGARAIWIAPLDGSAEPRLLETGLPDGSMSQWPRYSPDGRWVAFQAVLPSDPQGIVATTWVVAAAGGQAVQITSAMRMSAFVPAWSPEGTHLAVAGYAAPEGYLAIVPADSGAVQRLAPSAPFAPPAWSRDGSLLAYVTDDGDLAVISHTGSTPRVVVHADLRPRGPSWSPDGASLALSTASADGQSRNVFTVRLDGGQPEPVTIGRQWALFTAWSPDGEDIAFNASAERSQRPDIWIVSAYGGRPRRLTDSPADEGILLQWLEGGRRIGFLRESVPGAFTRMDFMSLDPGGGQPAMRLLEPPPGFAMAVPAPDRRRAVFVDDIGWASSVLHIADLPDGAPRSLGVQGMGGVFSPDGQRIAFIEGMRPGLNIWTIDVRPLLHGAVGPSL